MSGGVGGIGGGSPYGSGAVGGRRQSDSSSTHSSRRSSASSLSSNGSSVTSSENSSSSSQAVAKKLQAAAGKLKTAVKSAGEGIKRRITKGKGSSTKFPELSPETQERLIFTAENLHTYVSSLGGSLFNLPMPLRREMEGLFSSGVTPEQLHKAIKTVRREAKSGSAKPDFTKLRQVIKDLWGRVKGAFPKRERSSSNSSTSSEEPSTSGIGKFEREKTEKRPVRKPRKRDVELLSKSPKQVTGHDTDSSGSSSPEEIRSKQHSTLVQRSLQGSRETSPSAPLVKTSSSSSLPSRLSPAFLTSQSQALKGAVQGVDLSEVRGRLRKSSGEPSPKRAKREENSSSSE